VTTLIIFFFITVIEVPAGVILAVWFVLQLFSGVGQLASQVSGGGVAYWAHVGGFAFGALVAWLFYRNRRRPRPTGFDAQRGPDPF
jgi:membrane associated rhomboid family serine protease